MNSPIRIDVTMYQVGFGDCFLLTFHYDSPPEDGDSRAVRHMLVDFGSTSLAEESEREKVELKEIAELVDTHCGGRIDVVVASHRHRDHISGFGNSAVQEILGGIEPRLVLRPWTEDPQLNDGVTSTDTKAAFTQSLSQLQDFMHQLDTRLGDHARLAPGDAQLQDLRLEVALSVNDAADETLRGWSTKEYDGERAGRYLSYGDNVALETVIPGVHCDVLGPPTVDQWHGIVKQRYNDPDEFWLTDPRFQPGATELPDSDDDIERWIESTGDPGIGSAWWLLSRINDHRRDHLGALVEKIDGAINNTSLILVITAGERRLLFPGDAQIENWEYVLDHADDRAAQAKLLMDIDVYKVGHHGSRNATPRTLVTRWTRHGAATPPMVGLLSTKAEVHGKNGDNPVPKDNLVTALEKKMERRLYRTDTFDKDKKFVRLTASALRDGGPFEEAPEDPPSAG